MSVAAVRVCCSVVLAASAIVGGATVASGNAAPNPSIKSAAPISFSFRGYANNVNVVAPLVGPWQLGVARTSGFGSVGGASGFFGSITTNNSPKYPRFAPGSLRANVIGYSWVQGAHNSYRALVLKIQVASASGGGPACVPGVTGTLTLMDNNALLANHQTRDYIVTGGWLHSACPSFVQGWTNNNGGKRTSPQFGGPPSGGQWAIVNISSR